MNAEEDQRAMKLTIISDTHGEHEKLGEMSGDVLIHCGDMFDIDSGNPDDIERIDEWFSRQQFDLILCVGGNHDSELEMRLQSTEKPFKHAVCLQGTAYEHAGIKFFGAPWVPQLQGQAFYQNDAQLEERWFDIPWDTDVLITHTPPAGVLDVSSMGLKLGCSYLSDAIEIEPPILHCFGHVHASSGIHKGKSTTYVNAAMVNSLHELSRTPYEYELRK